MAPNVKERIINWSVSAATTIIGIVIAFKLSANDADNRELTQKIDKKLDKVEYEKDQTEKWKAHDKVEGEKDKRLEDMYQMVKELYNKEFKK